MMKQPSEAYAILKSSVLFRGMNAEERRFALTFLRASESSYKKGDYILRFGEKIPGFGLVLSGTLQVAMDDINGNRMIMATVTPGGTFGASLSFLDAEESPIYITATCDCSILWLHTDALRQPRACTDLRAHDILQRFISMLADKTLEMNNRIQILSKRTLREKLITFFSQQVRQAGRDAFTVPFDRGGMADYLGADRSALSRELSAMRREGILTFHKNEFQILRAGMLHD